MEDEILELNGIIPDTTASKTLELIFYGDNKDVWNYGIKKRLEDKYGSFSLEGLPDEDVFKDSKKFTFLGGEKSNICYGLKVPYQVDVFEVLKFGGDSSKQPYEINELSKRIAKEKNIDESKVFTCADHGLCMAVQIRPKKPDTIVNYDWHDDNCKDTKFSRSSWIYHFENNYKVFEFEKRPTIISTKSSLTKDKLDNIKGKVDVTVCLDVLHPTYADAVMNLREERGMQLEDLTRDIEMLQGTTDVESLSVCERRRVLDNKRNTANTVETIVKEFIKH